MRNILLMDWTRARYPEQRGTKEIEVQVKESTAFLTLGNVFDCLIPDNIWKCRANEFAE